MPVQQPGAMQRRHSSASSSDTSSEVGAGLHSRQTSQENVSLIPTRTTKVATSKPASNPLQFVKVGPCGLYRSAQEQIKKVEEVKKVKQELRDEAEDWQSNLDNWKCSRRKRQEHIIERVVEVKKFELEEFDRNRRRSKTFNEMLEERTSKGRKTSLPIFNDDDNDLSDLGISKGNDVQNSDEVFQEKQNGEQLETKADIDMSLYCTKENGPVVNGFSESGGRCNVTNDTEEYTYERAIQSYVNFTESRVRGRSLTPSDDTKVSNGYSKQVPPVPAKPRRGSCKIEEKLSELEQLKKRSVSTTDLSNNDSTKKTIVVPKVDILKRKELFEKNTDEQSCKTNNRLSGDFSASRSIRDRLFSLEKQVEEPSFVKKTNTLSSEISVKERLSNIEKNKAVDNATCAVNKVQKSSNDETSPRLAKDRISSLQKTSSNDNLNKNSPVTRLSNETAIIKRQLPDADTTSSNEGVECKITFVESKEDNFIKKEGKALKIQSNFERAISPEEDIYENKRQQHYRHRSLDSLDVDSNEGLGNESFERVQSLEDLDFCRNYPPSSLSGDTDREDSGIHTADVSSSVSQADDCDLHLDSEVDIKLQPHPTITEESIKNTTQVIKFETFNKEIDIQSELINVSQISAMECLEGVDELCTCKSDMVVDAPNSFLKLPLKLESSLNEPLPVILESPSEPSPAYNMGEINENAIENEVGEITQSSHLNNSLNRNLTEIENDSSSVTVNENNNTSNIPACDNDSAYNNNVNISDPENSPARDVVAANSLSLSAVTMDVVEVCMQDETSGHGTPVVEICHKIDYSALTSPLPTPVIEVDAEIKVDTQQPIKMTEVLVEEHTERKLNKELVCVKDEVINQFEALTVDVGRTYEGDNSANINDLITSGKDMLLTTETQCLDMVNNSTPTAVFHDCKEVYFPNKNEICLSDNGEVVFPLSPTALEPPKEKPPPPPTETSDDDDDDVTEQKSSSLRRLDSTKRIKKEIRQKRSSFLGLEGANDDSYLDPELELVRPPPDMTTLLAEERRLEQMMYRQSICSESDSNQESRDSGVELEKHHDDLTWSRVHHSRDNSETFGNTSTTSEEEEIVKKEREIIETLEQEELRRYATSTQTEKDNIGEKLALRLRELEQEKTRLEWERNEETLRRKAEEEARTQHESRIQAREEELRKQESIIGSTDVEEDAVTENAEQHITGEMLMSERERLEQEQAALQKQRESLMKQQWTASLQDFSQKNISPHSLQDINEEPIGNYRRPLKDVADVPASEYRRSMPDLATPQQRRPPPPIPPAKPLVAPRTQEKRTTSPQQMSRQTLHALSAAPRSRLIANDNWMQTKRKAKPPQDNYNYQHWLIQEAEHRRITEQQQRQAPPPRRPVPPPPPPSQHSQPAVWKQGTSSQQYTNWQPQQQQTGQWGVPNMQQRSDKPLPDSIIQTLTQRVQNKINSNSDANNNRRRVEQAGVEQPRQQVTETQQEKMLSVSGKKKCSHCGEELGRGAAMIIESLRLFYHINCFKCCVCCMQLGDGLMGTDVRVRNNKLHCHNCYSSDDGVKFSCV